MREAILAAIQAIRTARMAITAAPTLTARMEAMVDMDVIPAAEIAEAEIVEGEMAGAVVAEAAAVEGNGYSLPMRPHSLSSLLLG